jgi:hypothetical protein
MEVNFCVTTFHKHGLIAAWTPGISVSAPVQ